MTIIDRPEFNTQTVLERRALAADIQVEHRRSEKEPRIVGYVAKFNRPSQDMGGFIELIDPRAFTRTLDEDADVRFLHNHNADVILGRTKAGTLFLSEDSVGLRAECFPPDTEQARAIIEGIKRGDISGMSFAFSVAENGERWEYNKDGSTVRTLLDVDLHDVSSCVYPAYLDTAVAVRHLEVYRAMTPEERDMQRRRYELARRQLAASRPLPQYLLKEIERGEQW